MVTIFARGLKRSGRLSMLTRDWMHVCKHQEVCCGSKFGEGEIVNHTY